MGLLTHLTIAPKIQEDFEMRKGPDEVGEVVGLGGLERSAPRIPVIAKFFVAFVSFSPFVTLLSEGKSVSRVLAQAVM